MLKASARDRPLRPNDSPRMCARCSRSSMSWAIRSGAGLDSLPRSLGRPGRRSPYSCKRAALKLAQGPQRARRLVERDR